ncbi:MAG: leucine-rich repeat domain-containing protein [Bacteroidales bacterium]|nr:leucine-rich repeat domain-containing protein [Bacteroidales bacterium]
MMLIFWALMISFGIHAQTKKEKDPAPNKDEIEAYRYQSERIVEYLAETLNFLGDSTTIAKERQIVTNESYLKIFKNTEVQIEDDLIEDRIVPVYKDVRAYLRDIGFFYKQVHFDYVIQEIEQFYNSRKEINFRVTVNRHLMGTTIKDQVVENNMIRYIEIDLDHAHEVLKIVSIYSTRLEEKEDIEIWWSQLPDYWRNYFSKDINLDNGLKLSDVVAFSDSSITFPYSTDLEKIVTDSSLILLDEKLIKSTLPTTDYFAKVKTLPDSLQRVHIAYHGASLHSLVGNMMKQISVDISNESIYSDLTPLAKMSYLKELNLSGTPIKDISDLRNLSDLEKLNISNTQLSDISPLQYLINLKSIDFSQTLISDISTLAYNSALEEIKMNKTRVSDVFALARLTELKRLWMNQTEVSDISALANNKNLEIISFHDTKVANCSILNSFPKLIMAGMNNTKITDIAALNGLKNLQNIFINNTGVAEISTLTEMESLTRIYGDNTKISKTEAIEYMQQHPTTLVVFESKNLESWWNSMPDNWKKIWKETLKIKSNPDNDQLHQMVILKDLDFSFRKINNIDCLSQMLMLENLNVASNDITNLSALANLSTLISINFSKTKVNDITPLLKHKSLTTILCNETPITNLELLKSLKELQLIECDQCSIKDEKVYQIHQDNPQCLIIYRTSKNKLWWDNLSEAWKKVFIADHNIETPDKYQLQKMLNQSTINVKDNRSITNLNCLAPMLYLDKLIIANTSITSLEEIVNKTSIKYLDLSNNPIELIDNLSNLQNIDTLILENTPVKKIDVVSHLPKLKYLNFSGTQIKNLKPLLSATQLISIDFNNTGVTNISPLLNLPNLRQMKAFRTKVSVGKIDEFKQANPQCEVIFY